MPESIKNKISNLQKIASVTNNLDDFKQFPFTQVFYLDDPQEVVAMYPYGMSANAPLNNFAIVFNMGQEEKTLSLPFSGDNRQKNLKPGEVIIGNWETSSFIKFNEDKSIEVNSKDKVQVTAASDIDLTTSTDMNVSITGNANIIVGGTTNVTSTGNINLTAPLVDITGDLTVSGSTSLQATTTTTLGSTTISCTTLTATGAVSAASFAGGGMSASGGTLSVTGDVVVAGLSFNGHVHGGVTTGAGVTAGPQ